MDNPMRVTMRVTIFIVYCRIHVVVYLDGKSERRMTPGRYGRRKFLTLKKRTQITTQYQPRQGGAQKKYFLQKWRKTKNSKTDGMSGIHLKNDIFDEKFFRDFYFSDFSGPGPGGCIGRGCPGGKYS